MKRHSPCSTCLHMPKVNVSPCYKKLGSTSPCSDWLYGKGYTNDPTWWTLMWAIRLLHTNIPHFKLFCIFTTMITKYNICVLNVVAIWMNKINLTRLVEYWHVKGSSCIKVQAHMHIGTFSWSQWIFLCNKLYSNLPNIMHVATKVHVTSRRYVVSTCLHDNRELM